VAFIGSAPGTSHPFILHDPELLARPARVPLTITELAHGDLIELPLEIRAFACDRARGRVYAIAGGRAQGYPNSLITLDGATGRVLNAVHVGSEPRALTLSRDGSTLWVALSGSFEVRRVDLTGEMPVPGARIRVPLALGDGAQIGALTVLAGEPDRVVLTAYDPQLVPGDRGSFVVDGGDVVEVDTTRNWSATTLAAGPPGYAFGIDASASENLLALEVGPDGVSSFTRTTGYAQELVYDGSGSLYLSSGDVYDVRSPLAPVQRGRLAAGSIALLPGGEVVAVLACTEAGELVLRTYSTSTLEPLKSRVVDRGDRMLCWTSNLQIMNDGALFFIPPSPFDRGSLYMLGPEYLP
jgi:hypothetical protein